MLIVFGILFIWIENAHKNKIPKVNDISEITYKAAFIIGVFQLIAAVFPGTSRSGATIIGALLLGISRTTAAEFTFFLAIPAMFGGSAIKLAKFGMAFTSSEIIILILGMAVAFVVSMLSIKFLMNYVKKHDFKVFGWYRIVLGALQKLDFWSNFWKIGSYSGSFFSGKMFLICCNIAKFSFYIMFSALHDECLRIYDNFSLRYQILS